MQLHKDLGYPQDLVQLLEVESLKLSSKTWDDPKLRKKELELPLRIINAFHEPDSDTRFKVLTHLRRDQLVHMLVDWRAVIYTSSFNKVVDHILEPYRPGPNLEMILTNLKSRELAILLESSSFNRFRKFWKSCHIGTDQSIETILRQSIAESFHEIRSKFCRNNYIIAYRKLENTSC